MKNIIILFILTTVLFTAGCEPKEHVPPPVERVSLIVRFFDSIEKRDSASAARQGQKIYALDKSKDYVLRLISIQESNEAVAEAQNLLSAGKIDQALKVVSGAIKDYPHNITLKSTYPKLRQLRNAEKLLKAMKRAKHASAMRGARIATRAGLSKNMTPEFLEFLKKYEIREKEIAKQESKITSDTLAAAKRDAQKAKDEDAKREAENIRVKKETAEKTQAGEKLRQEAGDVPFEFSENATPDNKNE